MRALSLDYCDNGGLRSLLSYLFLATVLCLAIGTGWYFNSILEEMSRLKASVAKIEGRVDGQVTASAGVQMTPEKLAEVIKFSNQTIRQLNLPWDILFTQLTTAKEKDVALLRIEPNAKTNAIQVEGEAKDYASMLAYVRRLSEQNVLQGVYLTEHKMDDQNPDRPIRFILEASWVEK